MAKRKSTDTKAKAIQASIDVTNLQGLLPPNQQLHLNEETRIVTLLCSEPPQILAQMRLTPNEWCVFDTLKKSHPYSALYEELLACLTSLSLADCRTRILEAQEVGSRELNSEIKPVRQAISGIREKLRGAMPFLEVSSTDSGYGFATTIRHQPNLTYS